jgi:exonuclease SbcD
MRVLHTSDWHLGRSLEGRSRISEQEQFIDELIDITTQEQIRLVLVAGDVFDTSNPSAEAENLFFDALERLCDGGKRALVVIAGNHDSPERLHAANPLALKHGISLFGFPGEQLLMGTSSGGVRRLKTGPGWAELTLPGAAETAVVYALPYPSESRLNEVFTEKLDDDSQQIAYSERVGQLFAKADGIFRPDTVNLAVAHLFARGGLESESERQLGGHWRSRRKLCRNKRNMWRWAIYTAPNRYIMRHKSAGIPAHRFHSVFQRRISKRKWSLSMSFRVAWPGRVPSI